MIQLELLYIIKGSQQYYILIITNQRLLHLMNEQTQSTDTDKDHSGHQYFQLIRAVGSHHRYQSILIAIFSTINFLTGLLSLGTPYYLAVNPYHCPEPYSTPQQCNQFVCSQPADQRAQYEFSEGALRTLANEFGDYRCQKSQIVSTAMGMFFFGSLVGFIIFGSMVDHIGRRLTLLICLGCALLGMIFILSASNFVLADIGLFIVGFGMQNAFNMGFYYFTETLEDSHRQKAGVIVQIFYCLGALSIILLFYLIKNWRIIFWTFIFSPIVVVTILAFLFIKQTPQFLIKRYEPQQTRIIFGQIAKINKKTAEFQTSEELSIQSLTTLREQYMRNAENSKRKIFIFTDLFKLKSLRKTTILISLVILSIDIMYYGPVLLIDQFGFNIYLNGAILSIAELLTYAVTFFFITKIKRRLLSIVVFINTFVFSFILIFINQKEICTQNCVNAGMVIELMLIFAMRFCVSLEFQVLIIYINELYPVQVAGLGLSFSSIVAMFPNIFIPLIIEAFNKANISFMIIFIIFSSIGFVLSIFLKETRGIKPLQKVQQFGGKSSAKPIEIELVQQKS